MQYLDVSDLSDAYIAAQLNARRSWIKYDEFERLAANEVRTDLPTNMPKVNDGSLAASLRKVPKRIIAQPLTGTIKAVDRDEDWVAKLVDIILANSIIPNANTDAPFLSKWQTALKNALIYGSQPIYTFFTQHGTYTGADMSLPYVRNVYLEPGKVSDLSSDFIFMDSFYTKLQMKRLVDKAIADQKQVDEENLEASDLIWDPKVLGDIYDAGPTGKDSQNMTASERTGINRNEKGLYKLTTCFNRGYEAPFYTFSPNFANKVAGTQENSNPTGDVPIIYLYADEDLINPYGTGMVQNAGATQNVLDNLTQVDVLSTQIGAQPPLDIHGDRTTTRLSSLQYSPRAYWFTGNASVTPVVHQNPNFYGQLPNRIALYKSQLQYQTGTFDNTVPALPGAASGASGPSKTPQGVSASQSIMDADDSFMQQRVGEAYQRVIKSMVNIHMNNMEGSQLLRLEGDQIELLATTDLVPTDENGNPLGSQIEVVWNNVRGTFDFIADPYSGMKSNDQQQAALLQEAVSTISLPVAYYMAQDGWKFNTGEAYHSLFSRLELENIDKVMVKMTPQEKQAAQNAPFPIIDPPSLRIADVPEEYIAGVMQNAGVQPGTPSAASVKDQASLLTAQAAMLTAQAGVQRSQIESSATALNSVTNSHSTQLKDQQSVQQAVNPQPAQQLPGQTAPPTPPVNQTPQSTAPTQEGQQVAAQFANPAVPQQAGAIQTPAPIPEDPVDRLIDIASKYEVDPETAMTIAAAQDHGITDAQLPQVLQYLHGSKQ